MWNRILVYKTKYQLFVWMKNKIFSLKEKLEEKSCSSYSTPTSYDYRTMFHYWSTVDL